MERLFQILAVILAGVAVFFLWKDSKDATFVAAVGGAVCFFLSVRFQVKKRLKEREEKEFAEAEEPEADEAEETR